MSSQNHTESDKNRHKRSAPIIINPRRRSESVSSSSSGSTNSPTDLQTPISASNNLINIPSPSSSPILSYVLAQSPTKSPSAGAATFPFMRKFGTIPAFEGSYLLQTRLIRVSLMYPVIVEDERDPEVPAAAHARRASTAHIGRFSQQPAAPRPDPQVDRGTNVLRRLSLSFAKVNFQYPTKPAGNFQLTYSAIASHGARNDPSALPPLLCASQQRRVADRVWSPYSQACTVCHHWWRRPEAAQGSIAYG
jgi:hypothetical protein